MSDPTNTPVSGSPGEPGIRIPPAGAQQTIPQPPQTARISRPPTTPATDPRNNEPSRLEKIRLVLTNHKIFLTIFFCVVAALIAAWSFLPNSEKGLTAADIDKDIRKERDLLKKERSELEKKLAKSYNELTTISNALIKEMDSNTDLLTAIRSNSMVRAVSPTNSKPALSSQPTNQSVVQTEPTKNVGSGLVTVNENHGDIKIIIKNDDGERSVRTSNGPDKAEDIVPGLAKATGTESPVTTDKSVPSGGNGIRYYLPKGWSLNYKYYCSQDDFETFVNKGTREVPKWEAIDVSSDGKSESIWIRNLSRRNIKFTFTLTPAI
jgi:hypothetical protein